MQDELFDFVKQCKQCKKILPLSSFYQTDEYYLSKCRDCYCENRRNAYAKKTGIKEKKEKIRKKPIKPIQDKINAGKSLYKRFGLNHNYTDGQKKDIYLYLIFKTEKLEYKFCDMVDLKRCKKGYKKYREAQIKLFLENFEKDIFKREHFIESWIMRFLNKVNV